MALEDVLQALDTEARRECERIRDDAEEEVARIRSDAQGRAEDILRRAVASAEARARAGAARLVGEAKAASRRSIARFREDTVDEAFDRAAERLAAVRSDPAYPHLFRSLAAEALAEVRRPACLLVDPRDEALARTFLTGLGEDVTVEPSIASAGGVVASSDGGRVRRLNTVEDRLDKARKLLRGRVAEMLFQ